LRHPAAETGDFPFPETGIKRRMISLTLSSFIFFVRQQPEQDIAVNAVKEFSETGYKRAARIGIVC